MTIHLLLSEFVGGIWAGLMNTSGFINAEGCFQFLNLLRRFVYG